MLLTKEMQNNGIACETIQTPRILVAEDNMTDLILIKTVLEEMDYDVISVFDGESALELLVKEKFSFLILDWMMPGLNGNLVLEHTQELLNEAHLNENITPFVAFSGLSTHELQVPEVSNFEFVGHWRKPLDLVQLVRRVNDHLYL